MFRKCDRFTFMGVGSQVCAHTLGGMRQTASLPSACFHWGSSTHTTVRMADDAQTYGPEVPAGKGLSVFIASEMKVLPSLAPTLVRAASSFRERWQGVLHERAY